MNYIKNKILNLKKIIEKYNNEYYNNNRSLINDDEYDYLIKKLENLENKFPEFKSENSPTKKISGIASDNIFEKNKHYTTVQSLKNIFQFSEIDIFIKKIFNFFKEKNIEYILEYKIDGLTIVIEYLNGYLVQALTRGDGFFGENVTNNVLKINDIPKKIKYNKRLIIRGEIYITKKNFKIINDYRLKNKQKLFSNPRNTASGLLRSIDMSEHYKLSSIFFDLQNIDEFNFQTDEECLMFIKKMNFNTINFKKTSYPNLNIEINDFLNKKKDLLFNVDGVVIKLNDLNKRKILGSNSKFPRWAVAFKNKTNIAESKILNIVNNVGRSGVITPVAILEPTFLDGSIIKKATLYNYLFIIKKDIRIGDFVKICKAGEIIPKILSVNLILRECKLIKTEIPKYCPTCNNKLNNINIQNIICENKNCIKQMENNLIHYVSKDGMNIKFLGINTIKSLINNQIINNINDIYDLNIEKLCSISGIKILKANKILKSIEESKKCYLKNFIYALGINNVGKQTSNILSLYFKQIDLFLKTNFDELIIIKDLGKKTAQNIIMYINNNNKLIQLLYSNLLIKNSVFTKNTYLYNKSIVITGVLKNYNRNSLINLLINEYGALILNNISKKIDILIVGNNPGSKLKKAKLLNINIIYEDKLNEILSKGNQNNE